MCTLFFLATNYPWLSEAVSVIYPKLVHSQIRPHSRPACKNTEVSRIAIVRNSDKYGRTHKNDSAN